MSELTFTGERFIPGTRGEIWIEHWHRYHFAMRWAAGKRVLDVACGEGYGTALLARVAAHATGVDLSEAAIEHARRAYAQLSNAEFVRASCTAIPLPDASVDLAVSFETLEHIREHDEFLDELARVLKPDGVLVLSCPNKQEYSDNRNYTNEFHVRELYREQLAELVGKRFPHATWHGQRPTFYSLIAPDDPRGAEAQLLEVDEQHPDAASGRLAAAMYFVVVASRSREAIEAVPPALSVLSDRGDWVHRDYEYAYRTLGQYVRDAQALGDRLTERGHEVTALTAEIATLREAIQLQERALTAQQALAEAQAALHQAALAEKQAEIDRRYGWRYWLKLPLLRLGLLKR